MPIPAYPAPHPGESPPPDEPPEGILDPPPCGYLLDEAQYSGPQPDGRPVGERLAAHGISVLRVGRDRYFVPMRQDQRGLIPLLLDGEAAEPMVAAQRVGLLAQDGVDDVDARVGGGVVGADRRGAAAEPRHGARRA